MSKSSLVITELKKKSTKSKTLVAFLQLCHQAKGLSLTTTTSMSSLVLFLRQVSREVPGWLLWLGIFLPVTLLIIQIMVYLNWRLTQVTGKAWCDSQNH
uniref:Uncharacterized protein n=1 Tax=Esox lucius TaxID=8010 RepID=A0A3P8YW91_ESOLU